MTHTEDRRGAYRVLLSDNGNNIKKHLKEKGVRWTRLF